MSDSTDNTSTDNTTDQAATDETVSAADATTRPLRERLAAMPEKRRSFLAGLAVGAAVLGGAWGITSAFDDGHDRGDMNHEMSDDMKHGDGMHDRHDGHMGPMDAPMDGAGQSGGQSGGR